MSAKYLLLRYMLSELGKKALRTKK